jgi:glutaredoxin
MIELYRKPDCSFCDEIEEDLKELVIKHNIINLKDNKSALPFLSELNFPVIKDDDEIISGTEEIKRYMKELKKFVYLWRKYQVDACYVDEDGETC